MKPPALALAVNCCKGDKGLGTILSGCISREVLDYLQQCPIWEQWRSDLVPGHGACYQARCMGREQSEGMKLERVGYIDRDRPPQMHKP